MSFLSVQLLIIVFAIIYFLPSILAYNYGHENAQNIALINIFLGWSVIGWLIALIWVFSKPGGAFDNVMRKALRKC